MSVVYVGKYCEKLSAKYYLYFPFNSLDPCSKTRLPSRLVVRLGAWRNPTAAISTKSLELIGKSFNLIIPD